MKLEGQIFIWSVVALSGPVGMGLVTREFKQRWFWAGLMASGIVHAVVLWNLRTKLPAPNAFAPLLVGGIEGIGLAIMSGKIRDLMRQRSK